MSDATSFFAAAALPGITAPELTNASAPPTSEKVRDLAMQFEGLLMSQMLREMRRSMLDEEPDGLGADTTTDMVDAELGLALSRAGGLGLTDVLVKAFEQRLLSGQPAPVAGPARPESAPAVGAPEVAPPATTGVTPPAGPISSGFGWRADPFDGRSRFHAGTDIRMAYGQDVHAAAAGTVSYVGERPGYGLTVVVKHASGEETLYAHLSASDVHTGDRVSAGQPLARSGSSGRSTGPHLHFEVRRAGQPVDPLGPTEGVGGSMD